MPKILIVDDESDIVDLVGRIARSMGYEVQGVSNGAEALRAIDRACPDLVLLDVMMPQKDGWEVLQAIRNRSDVPVIMLSALGSADDHVKGFGYGADDYISKPFDNRVIKARIEAVMRRCVLTRPTPPQRAPLLKTSLLQIDDHKKEVKVRGERVKLTRKEYEFIRLLAGDPEKVFSSEEIIDSLWPKDVFVSSADVQQCAYLLRHKVEQDPKKPEVILNVRGFGYRTTS